MKWDFFGSGLGVLALGFSLMVALPPPWWPKMPIALIQLGIVFGLIIVVVGFGLMGIGSWPALPEPKGPYAFLLGGLVAAFTGLLWLAYYQMALHPTSDFPPTVTELTNADGENQLKPPQLEVKSTDADVDFRKSPVTMRELFETDFQDGQSTTWADTVSITEDGTGEVFEFQRKVFYNLRSRSKFISLHIPARRRALEVLKYVEHNLDWLENAGGFKDFYVRDIGNPFPTTGKDLVFSKVVYLYLDENLPSIEKAAIEQAFERLGVKAHLYDGYYLLAKSLDEQTTSLVKAKRVSSQIAINLLAASTPTPTPTTGT